MSDKHKETVDRFIGEIQKTCHAMIMGERYCESPIAMVREAISYLEDHHRNVKRERTKDQVDTGDKK